MSDDLVRYACRNCRYSFRRRASWDEMICPYCGQHQVEKEDTINRLIRDTD